MQVAERAAACEAVDKLAGPGGPFMLRLVDITWRGERAWLSRSGPDVSYVDHQQLGATMLGKLCRRWQCRAGGGRPIVWHHDMMKMPCCYAALWRN